MRIGHTNTIGEYSDVYGEYSDVYVTNSTIMGPDSDDDVHPVITGVSSNIHDASPNWRIEKSTTMGPDSDDHVPTSYPGSFFGKDPGCGWSRASSKI
jgi:hypothetical protein